MLNIPAVDFIMLIRTAVNKVRSNYKLKKKTMQHLWFTMAYKQFGKKLKS